MSIRSRSFDTPPMFTRLSRLFFRSKRVSNNYTPVPTALTELSIPELDPYHQRPLTSSSRNSSSCSIDSDVPAPAPSFLQVVCNDSQPVYCVETVPLYKPCALPPGLRKANSLYDSEHDQILKERRKLNGAWETQSLNTLSTGPKKISSTRSEIMYSSSKPKELHRILSVKDRERLYGFRVDERHRTTDYYTTSHPPALPPVYQDQPSTIDLNSQFSNILPHPPSTYLHRSFSQKDNRAQYLYQDHRFGLPTHRGPFPSSPMRPAPRRRPVPPTSPYAKPPKSIPAEIYYTRQPPMRQGPYPHHQSKTLLSPYQHPDFDRWEHTRSEIEEIPLTRITRLKAPRRPFPRENDVHSEIGLGRISGMAASRAYRFIKSDVGISTTTPSMMGDDKEKVEPSRSRRKSPQSIKIGKYHGKYKTSTMPAYLLTTPDTDSENEDGEQRRESFVPSSAGALASVTADRTTETEKWVADVARFTLFAEQSRTPRKTNTVDTKRHRVYSTTVDVQHRDTRSSPSSRETTPPVQEEIERQAPEPSDEKTNDLPREEISSWLGSEIFSIAKVQAKEPELSSKLLEDVADLLDLSSSLEAENEKYDELESLIDGYFEDVKVPGSDDEDG